MVTLILVVPEEARPHLDRPRFPLGISSPETLEETVAEAVAAGAREILLRPWKVNLSQDRLRALRSRFPEISLEVVTEVPARLRHHLTYLVRRENLSPEEIEALSFRMISSLADLADLSPEERVVVQRVIHATGDPDFRHTLVFHPRAIACGLAGIRAGKDVVTDVRMLAAAINTRKLASFGGRVVCTLSEEAPPEGRTRTETALERALQDPSRVGVIAIGNAPTALLKAMEIADTLEDPPLIVGLPVGFVKALEAKILLSLRPYPHITNLSWRGGSPAAAAVVNALLGLALRS